MPGSKKETEKDQIDNAAKETAVSVTGRNGMQHKGSDSSYTIEEFKAGAKALFGVAPELVDAALKNAGITRCTKEKAEKIVKSFVNREVK